MDEESGGHGGTGASARGALGPQAANTMETALPKDVPGTATARRTLQTSQPQASGVSPRHRGWGRRHRRTRVWGPSPARSRQPSHVPTPPGGSSRSHTDTLKCPPTSSPHTQAHMRTHAHRKTVSHTQSRSETRTGQARSLGGAQDTCDTPRQTLHWLCGCAAHAGALPRPTWALLGTLTGFRVREAPDGTHVCALRTGVFWGHRRVQNPCLAAPLCPARSWTQRASVQGRLRCPSTRTPAGGAFLQGWVPPGENCWARAERAVQAAAGWTATWAGLRARAPGLRPGLSTPWARWHPALSPGTDPPR